MNEINRRTLLKGSSLSLLGLVLSGMTNPHAVADLPKPLNVDTSWPLAMTGPSLLTDPGKYTYFMPQGPYTLIHSHTLSDDYFLTSDVILNLPSDGSPGDQVVPIVRADGTVEALVLAEGQVFHLSRDSTSTSGWTYTILFENQTDTQIDALAAALHPVDGNVYIVAVKTDIDEGTFIVPLYMTSDNQVHTVFDIGPPLPYEYSGVQPRVATDVSGAPLFYIFNNPSEYLRFIIDPNTASGPTILPQAIPLNLDNLGIPDVVDGRIVYELGDDTLALLFIAVSSNGTTYLVDYDESNQASSLSSVVTGDQRIIWSGLLSPEGFKTTYDVLLIPNSAGDSSATPATWTMDRDLQPVLNYDLDDLSTAIATPVSVAVMCAPPVDDTNKWKSFAMCYAVGSDGVLYAQEPGFPGSDQPSGTAPIPVTSDVVGVFAPPTPVLDNTMFVLDGAGTLGVMTRSPGNTSSYKDPTDGQIGPANPANGQWSRITVQQAAPTVQPLNTWRTQLTLLDASGIPAVGETLYITADYAVDIWQQTGHASIPGLAQDATPKQGDGTAFVTDQYGTVTLVTPAEALHAATYTVSCATSDLLPPTQAKPDSAVHAFFAGNNSLLSVAGADLKSSLVAATGPGGAPLFASVQNNDQNAQDLSSFLTGAMTAGAGQQPGPNDPVSFQISNPPGAMAPAFRISRTPSTAGQLHTESLSSWWHSVKRDVESVFKAVEQAAVQVERATIEWVQKTGDEVKRWWVTLDIGGWINDAIQYVVNDVKDAVTAITAAFHTLGADLAAAINWLKDAIGEFFADVNDAANILYDWLTSPTEGVNHRFNLLLSQSESTVDGWFGQLETKVGDLIDHVKSDIDADTITDLKRTPSTGGQIVARSASKLIGDITHDVTSNWLFEKIKSLLGESASPDLDISKALNDLLDGFDDAKQVFYDAVVIFKDALLGVASPGGSYEQGDEKQVGDYRVSDLLDALSSLATGALQFADAIVKAIIDLMTAVWDKMVALFTTPLKDLAPFLVSLLECLHIDIGNLTIGKMVCLVVAFGGTVIAKVRFGSHGTMMTTAASTEIAAQDGPPPNTDWTGFIATTELMTTMFAGIVDTGVDMAIMAAAGTGAPFDAPSWVQWLSAGFDGLANLTAYPFSSTGGATALSWEPLQDKPGGISTQLPVLAWGAGFIPPIIAFGAERFSDSDPEAAEAVSQALPWINSLCGALLTFAHCYATFEQKDSPSVDEKIEAIVGDLPETFYFLDAFVDESLGITGIIKIALNILCGLIEVGCDIDELLSSA